MTLLRSVHQLPDIGEYIMSISCKSVVHEVHSGRQLQDSSTYSMVCRQLHGCYTYSMVCRQLHGCYTYSMVCPSVTWLLYIPYGVSVSYMAVTHTVWCVVSYMAVIHTVWCVVNYMDVIHTV